MTRKHKSHVIVGPSPICLDCGGEPGQDTGLSCTAATATIELSHEDAKCLLHAIKQYRGLRGMAGNETSRADVLISRLENLRV